MRTTGWPTSLLAAREGKLLRPLENFEGPFRGPMPLQPPTSPARLPVRQAQRTGRLPCLRGYCAASRQTPTWSYALVRKKSPPVGRCPGADGEGAGRAALKTGPPRQNHPLRESIRFAPAPLPFQSKGSAGTIRKRQS